MKQRQRAALAMLLMMVLLLLSSCAAKEQPEVEQATDAPTATPTEIATEAASEAATDAPTPDPVPAAESTQDMSWETGAVIWYRFGEEPMLAAEEKTISRAPNETYETALLRALLDGPTLGATELSGLFPSGTRVISTARQGDMLFVTLSYQLMNRYADEPEKWQDTAYWATESPLRRRLAMQAIAATVTENTTAQQVVILVEQREGASDSLRLRQKYYLTAEDENALADPLVRDESLLLTASGTLNTLLAALSRQDFACLYRYVALHDAQSGEDRPEEDEFLAQMKALPNLMDFTTSSGSVFGESAVFTLQGTLLENGLERAFQAHTVQLVKQNGLWRIPLSQLKAIVEEKP